MVIFRMWFTCAISGYTVRDELKYVVTVVFLPCDGKGSFSWSLLSADALVIIVLCTVCDLYGFCSIQGDLLWIIRRASFSSNNVHKTYWACCTLLASTVRLILFFILFYYFSVFHFCILTQQPQAYRWAQSAMPDCTPQVASAHWDSSAGLPWK